jgi:hypothetical protein
MFKLSLLLITLTSLPYFSFAFVLASVSSSSNNHLEPKKSSSSSSHHLVVVKMSDTNAPPEVVCPHPFSQLPGDPSLLLVTNLDLGDKKIEIMKECSKAISAATGKPESYIGRSQKNGLLWWDHGGKVFQS